MMVSLQIHVRDGRVRLFTTNGADWSKRYPLIVDEAARLKVTAIMDAEVVCTGPSKTWIKVKNPILLLERGLLMGRFNPQVERIS
jgi:hypothetical protein